MMEDRQHCSPATNGGSPRPVPAPPEPATFGELRYARIAVLRRQIAAGTYFVPAARIADSVLLAWSRSSYNG